MLIITKYFEVLRFRMIRRFLKHNDVDKLFGIARQSNKANRILFNLSEVRNNYQWTYPAAES